MNRSSSRLVLSAALVAASLAFAQQSPRSMTTASWAIGYPVGSVRSYLTNVSFRGFDFDSRYLVSRHVSIGVGMSWQGFNQHFNQVTVELPVDRTVTVKTGAVTAPAWRYLDFWHAKGEVHFFPVTGTVVMPFLGLSLGPTWTWRQALAADLSFSTTGFNFFFAPEVGATVRLLEGPQSMGLLVTARYTFTTATWDPGVTNAGYASTNVGFYWLY